ncbi:hypothetical protein BC936DRAFT_138236, partial [Jimgerdemannia flammicorona]
MVGSILIEQIVKDVLPVLKTNYEGINSVIQQFLQSYKRKEDEFVVFQKRYNIQIMVR